MIKKLHRTIILLVTVVIVGLVLFPCSQVVAQTPCDSQRLFECPSGDKMRIEFDPVTCTFSAGYYQLAGSTVWTQMDVGPGYACNATKTDCRDITNTEFGFGCGSIFNLGNWGIFLN